MCGRRRMVKTGRWKPLTQNGHGEVGIEASLHNGRLYVLGGIAGSNLNDVWSSADGKNWEEETDDAEWAGRYSHQAVSHNGRLYVLGGVAGSNLNDVWSSADGQNWEEETDDTEWAGRWGASSGIA